MNALYGRLFGPGGLERTLNGLVWGPGMLALLVGTGVYLTVRTGFLPLRRLGWVCRRTVGSLFRPARGADGDPRALSPFRAMCTALAGTVGTGNIAGVTGAVFLGGPGAVFWMWVSAFFGMCTKYSEIALAVRYRERGPDGAWCGGPMYYIRNGLGRGWRWLAALFALLGGLASFGIGNVAQSSEIAGAVLALTGAEDTPGSRLLIGGALAAVTAAVLLGGVRSVGAAAGYLVPVMSGLFLALGGAVIALRLREVPAAFASILSGAFTPRAAAGGFFGCFTSAALRQGVARGVFSNEAGLGSAPIAHAAANTREPVEQAAWGIFEVFMDTMVLCTVTALALVLSGLPLGEAALETYPSKGAAAAAAFNAVLPGEWGGALVEVSLLFFALSTLISWSYYGAQCWGYLSGRSRGTEAVYKAVFVLLCAVGSAGSGGLMWNISDTLNGAMALPNLAALLLLSGQTADMTRDYFCRTARKNAPGPKTGGAARGERVRRNGTGRRGAPGT